MVQKRKRVFLSWGIICRPVGEDSEVERPVKLHRDRRQRRGHAMAGDDLLDGPEMLDANRLSGAVLGEPPHWTEDRLRRRRQEFSEPPEAAQFGPDQ